MYVCKLLVLIVAKSEAQHRSWPSMRLPWGSASWRLSSSYLVLHWKCGWQMRGEWGMGKAFWGRGEQGECMAGEGVSWEGQDWQRSNVGPCGLTQDVATLCQVNSWCRVKYPIVGTLPLLGERFIHFFRRVVRSCQWLPGVPRMPWQQFLALLQPWVVESSGLRSKCE